MITDGVIPSLHIDYKRSRIKQYHKEGRALRTETTINDPHDFGIGKRLSNLPALRRIGFQANRRLWTSNGSARIVPLAKTRSTGSVDPIEVDGQRASALRFADVAVQALLSSLLVFRLLASGFFQPQLARPLGSPAGKGP